MNKLTFKKADKYIALHSEEISSSALIDEPLVSVCFITHNHADFVEQALDSVLMQETKFPFEIIIGDDASTDGTSEIVDRYQRQHADKIKILRSTENLGKYTGSGRLNHIRNLRACRGKYIALLEGDDYWTDPHKLQRQVDFLEANPDFTMCFHNRRLLSPDDPNRDGQRLPEIMLRELTHEEIVMTRFWNPPTATLMLLRSAITQLPEWFFGIHYGDRGLAIIATQKGRCGYCADIGDAVYRIHAGGIASGLSKSKRSLSDIKSRKVVLKNVPMSSRAKRFQIEQIHGQYIYAMDHDADWPFSERLKLRVAAACHRTYHRCYIGTSYVYGRTRIFLGKIKQRILVK